MESVRRTSSTRSISPPLRAFSCVSQSSPPTRSFSEWSPQACQLITEGWASSSSWTSFYHSPWYWSLRSHLNLRSIRATRSTMSNRIASFMTSRLQKDQMSCFSCFPSQSLSSYQTICRLLWKRQSLSLCSHRGHYSSSLTYSNPSGEPSSLQPLSLGQLKASIRRSDS